jgi:hypothetical protein
MGRSGHEGSATPSGDGTGVCLTLGLAQKLRRRDAKTVRELPERTHADVTLTALCVADVVGGQAAEVGEGFLREAAAVAQSAYRVAEGAVSRAERGHPRDTC